MSDELKDEIRKSFCTSIWKDFFLGPGIALLIAFIFIALILIFGKKTSPQAKYFYADGHEFVEFPGYSTGFCHSPKCKCLQKAEETTGKTKNRVVKPSKEGKQTFFFPVEVVK